jgi:hypothetical protein
MQRTCRHFTGIQNKTCNVGVDYDSVRIDQKPKNPTVSPFPCLNVDGADYCPSYMPHTQADIEEFERAYAKAVSKFADFIIRKTEDCPHCDKHVRRLEQIGRCYYARPCGCRIAQGQIPEAWRSS